MTPRQKEFCRHYLLGLSAPAAARAAGYASCTAEKNAAAILSSPTIAIYLARSREAAALVTPALLIKGRDRMVKILDTGSDKEAALAYHALLRLYKLQGQLASQQLPQEIPPETKTQTPTDNPTKSNKKTTQTPDNQPPSNKTQIPETDHLPSGDPAFDISLSPTKPTLTKKPPAFLLGMRKTNRIRHKPLRPKPSSHASP